MTSTGLVPLLRPHLARHRRALAASSGLTVATILVDLARPWPLALAVDALVSTSHPGSGSLAVLGGLAAAAALVGVLSAVLDARATLVAEETAEIVGADVRTEVFGRAVHLELPWHDRMRSGELVARLTSDVGRVLDGLVAATAVLVPESLALLTLAVVLVVVDPPLAGVALAVVPVLFVLGLRQRRAVRAAQGTARSASGRLAARTTDLVRLVPAVHAFGRQDRVGAHFRAAAYDVRDSETAALRTQARWAPRPESVLALGSAVVLLLGGAQVLAGRHTIGELLVVLAYTRDLYTPVRSLARLSGSLAKAATSADRLLEVLDADAVVADRPDAVALSPRAHSLRFESVGFGYGDRPALTGLDLVVGAGETVALVGPSGAGKSTALGLVLRLRDPDTGRVSIDGTDVRDLRLASLREHVAYVPQDAWLFDGTLLENIEFGAARPCRAAAVRAGRLAALEPVVATLPQGWDTPLGEGGERLSGGQRRRVALARAIVSGAPVILLDEPTASLDDATAAAVVAALRDLGRHRTLLVATHDPAVMAVADRVVDLGASSTPTGREVNPHDDRPHRPARHPAARQDPDPVAQPLPRLSHPPDLAPLSPGRS